MYGVTSARRNGVKELQIDDSPIEPYEVFMDVDPDTNSQMLEYQNKRMQDRKNKKSQKLQ